MKRQKPPARKAQRPRPQPKAGADEEPPSALADARTLSEIARRIRHGMAAAETGRTPEQASAGDAAGQTGATSAPPEPSSPQSQGHASPAAASATTLPLARLAHELKTPLSGMAAAAEVIRDESLGPGVDERYRAYAADIHASAMHALAVVDRMLARGRGLKLLTTPTDIDANLLVASLVRETAPLAERQGLKLTARLAPAAPRIAADPTSLRQVVLNLVTNAMRASKEGGSVAVSTRMPRAGRAVIEVRDHGRGMSKADVQDLLSPGRKSPIPAPADSGGLGLGLPLVLSLCRQMGAHVAIDSAPGRGTKVTVTFGASAAAE